MAERPASPAHDRRLLIPVPPPGGIVVAVWLFLLVLPLLWLLVWVNRWLDLEEQWRELAARRAMMNEMQELRPRLNPTKRLEEALREIEVGLGFPAVRGGASWKAASGTPGLDSARLNREFCLECRRRIGCEPVFLLTAGADGRTPELSIHPGLMPGAPPRPATWLPLWLALAGWPDRTDWIDDQETRRLRRRWSGSMGREELARRCSGLLTSLFGGDPFTAEGWGLVQPFIRMRPGGGAFLAVANFVASRPGPSAAVLGGYVAVFRRSELSRRFLLEPLLKRPGGGIAEGFTIVPAERRTPTHIVLTSGAPAELLQEWSQRLGQRPFRLVLRRERAALRHPFRDWQPWLRGLFLMATFGSGLFLLLKDRGSSLPLNIRGQLAAAVGVATVLPLLAGGGVVISYLDFRREIDHELRGRGVAERLELLENGLAGHLEALKHRIGRLKEGVAAGLTAGPSETNRLVGRIRRRASAQMALLITDDGQDAFDADAALQPRTGRLADKLAEMARTISMRVFLAAGCFAEEELDRPPRSGLWTRRRRAVASNISMIDIATLLESDGKALDPKFSGITDSILFQYMVKHPRTKRIQALLYVMYDRAGLVRMYLDSLERRREPASEFLSGSVTDVALFGTLDLTRRQLDPAVAWPRAAEADPELFDLARHALTIPAGTFRERSPAADVVALVRSFSGFGVVAVGRSSPLFPGWAVWEDRLVIAIWSGYAILLTMVVTTYLTRNFLRPIRTIADAGNEVAAGRYDVTLHLPTGDEFGGLADEFNAMTAGLRERERLARFVSKEVLETVRSDDTASLDPGGERRRIGILFAHIVGFDRIAAGLAVDGVFELLNDLLPRLERNLHDHGGSLDKVVGDGVMGVFHSGPIPAATRACRAAMAIRQTIGQVNAAGLRTGLEPLRVSIGLASGSAVCGRIGSRTGRLDFTAIGDPVNLAARLEAESRSRPGAPVLLDEETAREAEAEVNCTPLDIIQVRGRVKPVRLFTIASGGEIP
ncbi:MAG TPA: adenylate/guanylate cyclase domain-containing protein [Candidatus Ozemobacteraceae bacterium]|nr:adenylate/guanylate cyclase domain-containing protein [Candidatus Ozemobacteraceae bacterium]